MVYRWDRFDEAMDLGAGLLRDPLVGLMESRGAWTPPVDIFETDAAFFIKAEAPGLVPDALKVEVLGDKLLIAGERLPVSEARRYHHIERVSGPFERRFKLPPNLASDSIEASYQNGVLEIRLPKREAQVNRNIQVTVKNR